jgi:Amino acid synthesis
MQLTESEAPMSAIIRKTLLHVETTLIEGGRTAATPLKLIAAAAVVKNPWAGRGFVENLKPEIHDVAPELGALLTAMILEAAGSGAAVEGYGKAAVVGLDGELEHASALIHTLRFGNHYRTAVAAKSYLSFTNIRGGANTPIMIPLMDKNDEGRRSHYLTIHFAMPDAPAADEIVVALGASIGGRPHHRIGDRYQDLKDLGNDAQNPAAV